MLVNTHKGSLVGGVFLPTFLFSTIILELPSSIIIFILFLNSSATSKAFTGLIPVDLFALGIANGKFNLLNIILIFLLLGNLTATVLSFAVAKEHILDDFFFFFTNVIGPGHSFLYNFKKVLLI